MKGSASRVCAGASPSAPPSRVISFSPRGPGRPPLLRRGSQPLVARRPHLRLDVVRLLLHGLHGRCLLPAHRGLAGGLEALRTDLALDALDEMAIWARGKPIAPGPRPPPRSRGPVPGHPLHRAPGRGGEAVNSVGSKGDSYDNALAESVNGLYKGELIARRGPWRSVEQVELATAEWVDWWNHGRLHGACGRIPPAEFEESYYRRLGEASSAA